MDKMGSSKIAHTRFKPKDFVNTAKNAHSLHKVVYVSTSKHGEIVFKKPEKTSIIILVNFQCENRTFQTTIS